MSNYYPAEIVGTAILGDSGVRQIVFRSPSIASTCSPGQFVNIACGGEHSSHILRRPISIAGADRESGCVDIRFDIKGAGTAWMAELKTGELLDVIGPLGKGYPVEPGKKCLVVGGGTGIYSVLFLAKVLGADCKALLGFRNSSLINSTSDFESYGCGLSIITDDGSSGRKGFVTELVAEELDRGGIDTVYACGPMGMLKAVNDIVGGRAEYYVSLEERMGCGVGACMSCVCHTLVGYKRVCADGPVFNAGEVCFK